MICLTFDTDYVPPRDMKIFLKEFEIPGQGTFFLDQPYEALFGDHEVAPHPIILGQDDWMKKIELSESFPVNKTIRGFRSHSLVFSQTLAVQLAKKGYLYTSVESRFYQTGIQPVRQPWGLWELPIYYMDNADFCFSLNWPQLHHKPFQPEIIEKALSGDGTYVFDFHPLHIILNTRDYSDYQKVKTKVLAGEKSLFELAYPGYGTRSFYLDLIAAMKNRGIKSHTAEQAVLAQSRITPESF